MKKLLSILLVLSLLLCSMLTLASCDIGKDDEECTAHKDKNGDGKCDNCKEKIPLEIPTDPEKVVANLDKIDAHYDYITDEDELAEFLGDAEIDANITALVQAGTDDGAFFIIFYCASKSDASAVEDGFLAFVEDNSELLEEMYDIDSFISEKSGKLYYWGDKALLRAAMTGKYSSSAKLPEGEKCNHTDKNSDGMCDNCGYQLSDVPAPTVTDPGVIIDRLRTAGADADLFYKSESEFADMIEEFDFTAKVGSIIRASIGGNDGIFVFFCASEEDAKLAEQQFYAFIERNSDDINEELDLNLYRGYVSGVAFCWGHTDAIAVINGDTSIKFEQNYPQPAPPPEGGNTTENIPTGYDIIGELLSDAGAQVFTHYGYYFENYFPGINLDDRVDILIESYAEGNNFLFVFVCYNSDCANYLMNDFYYYLEDIGYTYNGVDVSDYTVDVYENLCYFGNRIMAEVSKGNKSISLDPPAISPENYDDPGEISDALSNAGAVVNVKSTWDYDFSTYINSLGIYSGVNSYLEAFVRGGEVLYVFFCDDYDTAADVCNTLFRYIENNPEQFIEYSIEDYDYDIIDNRLYFGPRYAIEVAKGTSNLHLGSSGGEVYDSYSIYDKLYYDFAFYPSTLSYSDRNELLSRWCITAGVNDLVATRQDAGYAYNMYSLICYNDLEAMKAMSQLLAYNAIYPGDLDPYGIYVMERRGNVVHFGSKRLVACITADFEEPYLRLVNTGYSCRLYATETDVSTYANKAGGYYRDTLAESLAVVFTADQPSSGNMITIAYCIDESAAQTVASIYSQDYSNNYEYYNSYGYYLEIVIDGTTVYYGTYDAYLQACGK